MPCGCTRRRVFDISSPTKQFHPGSCRPLKPCGGVTLNLDDKRGSSRIDTIDTALTRHSRAETAEWRAFLDTTMAFMLLLFVVRMLIIRNAEHISDYTTVIEVLTMSPPDMM